MSRLFKVWFVATLAFVLAGCGTNNITLPPTYTPAASATPTATATRSAVVPAPTGTPTSTSLPSVTPTPAAATALFWLDASNRLNPFPSDRLLDGTGHVNLPPEYLQIDGSDVPELEAARAYSVLVANQLKDMTGFSTFAPLRVRFDQAMSVDAGTAPRGILVLEYDDLNAAPAPVTASSYDPESTVEIRPVVPLKSKTRYALVLSSALVDRNGNHAQPSPEFVRLINGQGLTADQETWRATLAPVITYVDGAYGIKASDIVLVEVFTTAPTTDDLIAIKNRVNGGDLVPGLPVFDQPLGNLQTGIFAEGTPQYTDLIGASTSPNVAAVGIGYFESFDFRNRPNGSFDPQKVNGPTVPSTNKLDFYMVLPKAAKPEGGYPIVLFGHGLGGSGRDVVGLSELGDSMPFVGIGISALQHGRRGNPTSFFNFQNIATTRENFRQSVADFVQVIRMIERAHAAGIAPFDSVDPNHIEYMGVSLGGIMGTVFMGVEPDVRVGMLSVPGGGLPNILDSKEIGALLEPLLSINVGIAETSPYFAPFMHRFQQMAQWALDAGDPINYAPHIIKVGAQLPGVPRKRVLVHEGIVDNVVPNRTTDDLALAMGLPDLNQTLGCADAVNGCSGIWRFVMSEYGKNVGDGHGVTGIVPQASHQALTFLENFGTEVLDASPSAN